MTSTIKERRGLRQLDTTDGEIVDPSILPDRLMVLSTYVGRARFKSYFAMAEGEGQNLAIYLDHQGGHVSCERLVAWLELNGYRCVDPLAYPDCFAWERP